MQLFYVFLPFTVLSLNENLVSADMADSIHISLPVMETQEADRYICYVNHIDDVDEAFLESCAIDVNRDVVHHISTAFCEEATITKEVWDCTAVKNRTCRGRNVNAGGWDDFVLNTEVFRFPPNVTLKIGRKTKLRYVLTEIHYKMPVKETEQLAANVTLNLSRTGQGRNYLTYVLFATGFIPPNAPKGAFTEMACRWRRPEVYAYRYFVHTHHYGYLVEGFLVRNDTWRLLGSQLSMNKSRVLFDIPGGPILIQPGDIIAARCFFINPNDKPVKFGMTDGDEMCNFQLDIAYDRKDEESFIRPIACPTEAPEFSFCNSQELSGLCR